MSDEREKFIEDYLKAFRAANPEEPEPKIWYRGYGWYGFRDDAPFDLHRARLEPPVDCRYS